MGSTIASETTAATTGTVGNVRRDPFAMLPFCGYHMGDYFAHWLDMGEAGDAESLPKIFAVNWFRKDADGKFLWPGYGDNSRVLKWIFERTDADESTLEGAVPSPVGLVPAAGALDISGLDVSTETLSKVLEVNADEWRREATAIRDYYKLFSDHLPYEMLNELSALEERLGSA